MTTPGSVEQALWRSLRAAGGVEGEPVVPARTPWAVRFLMGAAGWLAACFFQVFILGGVFAAVSGNAVGITLTGVAMIALAVVLYRRQPGIAVGQFALAASLGGQGLVLFGVGEAIGGPRAMETVTFWAGVTALEVLLYVLVPSRLHRTLSALGAWVAVGAALAVALSASGPEAWHRVPWALAWLLPLACALGVAFTVMEDRLCAAARDGQLEPAADATLLAALAAALASTGLSHPLGFLESATDGAGLYAHWLGGGLTGGVLAVFAYIECRRLAQPVTVMAAVLATTFAFAAVMADAPAIGAGALAMGLALRRASLPWLGLGIAAIGLGFVWYYSSLHWTLLAKSATLAAAGLVLLAARLCLTRRGVAKEAA